MLKLGIKSVSNRFLQAKSDSVQGMVARNRLYFTKIGNSALENPKIGFGLKLGVVWIEWSWYVLVLCGMLRLVRGRCGFD